MQRGGEVGHEWNSKRREKKKWWEGECRKESGSYKMRDWERKCTVTATVHFSLTAWLVLVWVLVSSADICQPTSPNYCPGSWRSPGTHGWNERKNPWQGRLFLFSEGGGGGLYYLLLPLWLMLWQVKGWEKWLDQTSQERPLGFQLWKYAHSKINTIFTWLNMKQPVSLA